jgi:hypothetical protein
MRAGDSLGACASQGGGFVKFVKDEGLRRKVRRLRCAYLEPSRSKIAHVHEDVSDSEFLGGGVYFG